MQPEFTFLTLSEGHYIFFLSVVARKILLFLFSVFFDIFLGDVTSCKSSFHAFQISHCSLLSAVSLHTHCEGGTKSWLCYRSKSLSGQNRAKGLLSTCHVSWKLHVSGEYRSALNYLSSQHLLFYYSRSLLAIVFNTPSLYVHGVVMAQYANNSFQESISSWRGKMLFLGKGKCCTSA